MRLLFEFYDRFEYIFRISIPLFAFIVGFIISKLRYRKSNGKIRSVLSLTKDDSSIIIPIWEGTGIVEESRPSRKCMLYKESFIIHEIKTTVNDIFKSKFAAKFEGIVDSSTLLNPQNNHFYFGGYHPHANVYRLLKQYCSNVKFSCDESKYENHKHKDVLYPCTHEGDIRHIKIDDFVFSYDCVKEGYVILIKLTNKVLKDNERGTVHICFGNSATATLASAQCFNRHRVELYNRLKKRKIFYFAIMKCYSNGEIDFTSFKDITDKVFINHTV